MGNWLEEWLSRPAINLPRQHLLTLEVTTELADAAAKLPSHEFIDAELAVERKVNALPRADVFVKLSLPSMMKVSQAFRRKLAQIRAMDVLLAAERYRMKHGKWPAKLEDIPKEMLPAVPLDPYDGKPLLGSNAPPTGVVAYGGGRRPQGQRRRGQAAGKQRDAARLGLRAVGREEAPPAGQAVEAGPSRGRRAGWRLAPAGPGPGR